MSTQVRARNEQPRAFRLLVDIRFESRFGKFLALSFYGGKLESMEILLCRPAGRDGAMINLLILNEPNSVCLRKYGLVVILGKDRMWFGDVNRKARYASCDVTTACARSDDSTAVYQILTPVATVAPFTCLFDDVVLDGMKLMIWMLILINSEKIEATLIV